MYKIKNMLSNYLLIVFIWCTFSHSFADTKTYHYAYDNNGNTIAINQINGKTYQQLYTYHYNNLNQMVGFEDIQNQRSFGYVYYPDGRRLSKQGYSESDQEAIVFYYGHQGQLMNESYSKNNQIQKQSSYFAGLRFIDDLVNHNDSHIQYPIADQHNHPATLSFAQGGSRIESYQLTDYGQLAQSNIKKTEIATQTNQLGLFNFELNPRIYGSGYYDSESNLQYMGARYYSANTQRFMAQDSYNLLNRYNYANANPVMNYDQDGHSAVGNFIKNNLPHSQNAWIRLGVGIGMVGIIIATDGIISGLASAEITDVEVLGANEELLPVRDFGAIEGLISTRNIGAKEELVMSSNISETSAYNELVKKFMTPRQGMAYIANVFKNEMILFGIGVLQQQNLRGGINSAGLSNNGQIFFVNLISSWFWIATNKSSFLDDNLLIKDFKLHPRLLILTLEGELAYLSAQSVNAIYDREYDFDYKMALFSLGLGNAWDGIAELNIAQSSYGQSLAGTGWGALLNYGASCISGDCYLEDESLSSWTNNSMMYGAYFSTMPGMY